MENYGTPDSFNKKEANQYNDPGEIKGASPPPDSNAAAQNYGNFDTGNYGSGYHFGPDTPNGTEYSHGGEAFGNTEYSKEDSGYKSSENQKNSGPSEEPPPEGNLRHMVNIMKAALPHLDSQTQESASLIIKTTELMDTLQAAQSKDRVSAFSFRSQDIDFEALLTSIRNVCYSRERQLIDNILGFLRMKTMFETYSTLSSMMNTGSESTENASEASMAGGGFGAGFNPNMMEMLGAMLTPEQKSTFDNISMMFNMMQE